MNGLRLLLPLSVALLAACGTAPSSQPTLPSVAHDAPAGCAAPDDGARAGYHSPGDLTWIVECEPALERAYWRVFVSDGGEAAMIPRPDGDPRVAELCSADDALANKLREYTLCDPAPKVDVINAMAPEDALALAHALHERLRFDVGEHGVTPFAIPSDVADICTANPELEQGSLSEVCSHAKNPVGEMARVMTEEEATIVAAKLNELYGIES